MQLFEERPVLHHKYCGYRGVEGSGFGRRGVGAWGRLQHLLHREEPVEVLLVPGGGGASSYSHTVSGRSLSRSEDRSPISPISYLSPLDLSPISLMSLSALSHL